MNLLVIRFSAMGDVALLAPVVYNLLEKNPEIKITVLSRPAFKPIFAPHKRMTFIGADLKGKHKGFGGLYKLYSALKRNKYDAVIDLHDVLRTHVLTNFFKIGGTKILRFDKGRKEKNALLKNNDTLPSPLKHATSRYFEVFEKLKLQTGWLPNPIPPIQGDGEGVKQLVSTKKEGEKWIGIAPYAQHESKIWEEKKMVEVMKETSATFPCRFFLFGGGDQEVEGLKKISTQIANAELIAGKYALLEELALMQHLDVMVSMDSANMHLASRGGCKVVSIWGPTHPSVGFAPLFNEAGIVQVEMPCRPCSVFGKIKTTEQKTCAKKSMEAITPQMVIARIKQLLA